MTAMRRARATIVILRPPRCASWDPHVLNPVDRPRFIMTVAAWHNARLRLTSPALVIPLDTSRSPDWLRVGVMPTQRPTLFEDRKWAGSLTTPRKVSATTAPIPGIVMRRRHTGSSPVNWRMATAVDQRGSLCRQTGGAAAKRTERIKQPGPIHCFRRGLAQVTNE